MDEDGGLDTGGLVAPPKGGGQPVLDRDRAGKLPGDLEEQIVNFEVPGTGWSELGELRVSR